MNWWAAIDTESVSDSGSSNTVLAVSLGLVALGVVLLAVTVWYWRVTRPDPEALGPLVVMSDRDFARRGPIEQRRALDAARPGAATVTAPPPVDVEPVLEPDRWPDQAIPVDDADDDDDDEDDVPIDDGYGDVDDDEFDDVESDGFDPPVPTVANRPIDPLLSRIDPGSTP